VEKRWEEKLWWSWLQGVFCFQFCGILAADILVAHWQKSDKTPTAATNPVNPWNSKMLNSPPLFDIKQLLSFFMPATLLFCPCLKNLSLKSHINKQSDMVDSSN
jgi:hypothetical protein